MFRLHTQWTTDFAVRLVRPIEDWLNYNCPVVPRRWLDGERVSRHFLELDFRQMMDSVERDYKAQIERELKFNWPAFIATATIEEIIEQNDRVIHVSFAPRHRFFPLKDYCGYDHSPEFFKYLAKTAGEWAKRDVEKAVADALARMQSKEPSDAK